MDDVEESEEDIEDDHLEGLKDVIEGETEMWEPDVVLDLPWKRLQKVFIDLFWIQITFNCGKCCDAVYYYQTWDK